MLFCVVVVVVVVINASCYHSSGYCLLPPALSPPSAAPQSPKEPKGLGIRLGGQRGLLQQNQTSVSRVATQKLAVSACLIFLNERVEEEHSVQGAAET